MAQVADEFGPEHFARGLERLAKQQHSEMGSPPLSEQRLDLAVQMANGLADMWSPSRGNLRTTLHLPDTKGIMASRLTLYYNDADWLVDQDLRLVHPNILNSVAQQLGVQSLRYHHQVRLPHHASCPPCIEQLCFMVATRRQAVQSVSRHNSNLHIETCVRTPEKAACFQKSSAV